MVGKAESENTGKNNPRKTPKKTKPKKTNQEKIGKSPRNPGVKAPPQDFRNFFLCLVFWVLFFLVFWVLLFWFWFFVFFGIGFFVVLELGFCSGLENLSCNHSFWHFLRARASLPEIQWSRLHSKTSEIAFYWLCVFSRCFFLCFICFGRFV